MEGSAQRKRGATLVFLCLSVSLLIATALAAAGIADWHAWKKAVAVALGVLALMVILVPSFWDPYLRWDRRFTYIPVTAVAATFSYYIYESPEIRFMAIVGLLLMQLYLASFSGFLVVLASSLIMSAGYAVALVLAWPRIADANPLLEVILLLVFLFANVYIAFLFEGLRRRYRVSRRRYQTLARLAPVGIFQTDAAGRCIYVNEAWCAMAGLSAALAAGDGWNRAIHPDDRERVFEVWTESARLNRRFQLEYRFARPDGRVTWVFGQSEAETDAAGRAVGYVGTITDISERILAQEATEAANRAKGDFLANMSHEIRTPITGVIGASRLLASTEIGPEAREYIEIISHSSDALLHLIDDVLDFSKIEAGKLELETTDFLTKNAVSKALRLLTPQADSKGLELDFRLDDDVPERLRGDPGRLGQVLVNLLSNAVKFTKRGRVEVEVRTVAADGEGVELAFTVRDPGIGIAPEVLERLFKPFAQADTSTTRRYGGTGLGLVISQRLVEMMGGELRVESEPGRGSSFTFNACFARSAEPTQSGIPRPEAGVFAPQAERGNTRGGYRVLLAEDNRVNQLIALRHLRQLGYQVHAVDNGEEVLEAQAREPYDVILMDCQMPGLDGYEATRRIRRTETDGRRTLVIAVTANAIEGDRERCLSAGMDDYVSKPYDGEKIDAVLRRWLGVSEAVRQQ